MNTKTLLPRARWRRILGFLVLALGAVLVGGRHCGADDSREWTLRLRKRVETKPGSGKYHAIEKAEGWKAKNTAVIVCDMWDLHHCLNATRRVGEMAPRMNGFLNLARKQGATIIHAPSSCMEKYRTHPARRRAREAPRARELPRDIGKWLNKIPAEDRGKYPIDQSDGGEDDDPVEHQEWAEKLKKMGRNPRAPWKSQIDKLEIHDSDYISDSGEEIWSVLEHNKAKNVVLVGVHTNMCVLGRPFGLRQMAKNGKNVVLMRDMTDTMYNPKRWPYVSHFSGTDLIVEHIEKFVCPTITSDQFLGGKPFQFKHDRRPHVVVVIGEREYLTNETLPKFAVEHLGKKFRVSTVHANAKNRNDFPGLEVLKEADILLLSVRRRWLPKPQMELVRAHIAAKKPIVGIRTSSHPFHHNGKKPPEGLLAWPEFDHEVIGGNYKGHHGKGPNVELAAAGGAAYHPVLAGVDVAKIRGIGSLYKNTPLRDSATALIQGTIPGKPTEPIAWVNRTRVGGKAFYTSLGHPDDFKQPGMNRLLKNAVLWAAGMETE